MPILNYTTQIATDKTIGQIQAMLAKAGAVSVLTEYDDDCVVSSVSFRLMYNGVMVSFRLPARIGPLFDILYRDPNVPRKSKTREQAARVAWRIIKDWVEAQLAIVEAEQVELVEVFRPFAQDPTTGKTLFSQFSGDNLVLLTHDRASQ